MTTPHPPPPRGKAVTEEERKEILALAPHYSPRAIARRVQRSRNLVRNVLQEAGLLPPPDHPKTKLGDYRDAISQRVQNGLKVPRIQREIQAMGYTGGRTILGELVRHLRAQLALTPRKKIRCRFETRAGEEMQVDWALNSVLIGGHLTRVHILGVLLAHSRKVHYRAYRNEKQETLLEALARALEYFGGSALHLVFDNMATAVLGRSGPDRRPIWNPRLLEFARHYGFTPVACAVRDPDRKGKKEKSFRLLEDDCLRGSRFDSWDDLQRRLQAWLDDTPGVGNLRRHGTTGLVPNDVWLAERDLLVALPDRRFMVGREEIRTVDADATVAIGGCRYSVPAVLAGHQVIVRLYAEHFEVLDPRGTMVFSRSYIDRACHPGNLVIEPTHYANQPRRPKDQRDGGRLDREFLNRFPTLTSLVEGLKTKMKTIAPIHLCRLLRLVDTYGEEAFLAAATTAQRHHRFDAYAVQRILERENPLPPEVATEPITGKGAALLGEVEESTFDDFAYLDQAIDIDTEDPDGSK